MSEEQWRDRLERAHAWTAEHQRQGHRTWMDVRYLQAVSVGCATANCTET